MIIQGQLQSKRSAEKDGGWCGTCHVADEVTDDTGQMLSRGGHRDRA